MRWRLLHCAVIIAALILMAGLVWSVTCNLLADPVLATMDRSAQGIRLPAEKMLADKAEYERLAREYPAR